MVAAELLNPGIERTVTVTVTQYEYPGGPSYQTQVQRTFSPSGDGITNGIVVVGQVTLPVKDIAPDNTQGYFTVFITDNESSSGGIIEDLWLDCLFLDTVGQTVIVSEARAGAYIAYYLDAPGTNSDIGRILGTNSDRTAAISVMDQCLAISGGPLTLYPAGDNMLLAYAVEGSPQLALSYVDAWFLDRLS